jgi:RHS repeat-associated protein
LVPLRVSVVAGPCRDSFKYDPFGRRIYKSSSSGTSIYAYDGDNLVEETNAAGAVVARYSQGLNIDELLAMLRGGTTSYYQADGLGSLTSLSNTSGVLANTYTYDSFGNLAASTASLTNSFRYTGREFDTETSLYYYRARYYDQATGRFLDEDPIRFDGGVNFYEYTGGNPISWFDPFGLDWIRYTGQTLTVYGGSFGDTSKTLETCNATSGDLPLQSPKYQHTESGPVPEGKWRINLGLDPARPVGVTPYQDGYTTVPGLGVQWIGPGSPDRGTWRARLEKVSVQDNRVNTFYLHNSHKGYTHGCVETCDDLYRRFVDLHNQGVGYIYVDVRYAGSSTNGGTKQ